MALHAITNDATLRVVEWGESTLRAAGAGETAHINTVNVSSQSVIDTNGPKHTKIVANDFTAMSAAEIITTDLIFPTAAPSSFMMDAIVVPNIGWGALQPSGSGSAIGSISFFSASVFDSGSAGNDDGDGRYFESDTSSSIGGNAGIILAKKVFRIYHKMKCIQKMKFMHITNIRFWSAVLNSTTHTVMLAADVPAEKYIGVRYSTDAGDTTFQFASSDGISSNLVDSGVTVIALEVFHFLYESDPTAGHVKVSILDRFGTELATHTFTTNLPIVSVALGNMAGIQTRENAQKDMRTYYWGGVNMAPQAL